MAAGVHALHLETDLGSDLPEGVEIRADAVMGTTHEVEVFAVAQWFREMYLVETRTAPEDELLREKWMLVDGDDEAREE